MTNISRLEQDIVIDHRLLIHTSSGLGHPFPAVPPYFPFPFTPSVADPCPTLPVTETAMAGGARQWKARPSVLIGSHYRHAELTSKPYNVVSQCWVGR